MTKQLFEGQKNHPLSKKELDAFWGKVEISGRFFSNDNAVIKKALMAIIDSPTGREQIREIINHPTKKFYISASRQADAILNESHADAMAFNESNDVFISSALLTKVPANYYHIGSVLLHELMHTRQPESKEQPALFAEAETYALTNMLAIESFFGADKDVAFEKTYQKNYQRWLKIAHGRLKKPHWAPHLKLKPNLTPQEQEMAKEMYARQMASSETTAQFIEDFIASEQDLKNGGKSQPFYSYKMLATQRDYDQLDTSRENNWDEAIQDLNELKKQYPSLNVEELVSSLTELKQEHAQGNKNSIHQPVVQRKENMHYADEVLMALSPYLQNGKSPANLTLDQIFKATKDIQGSPTQKIQLYKILALDHYNKNNPKQASKILSQCTDIILNDYSLSRAEKLNHIATILAFSQKHDPQNKENRRDIVQNLNKKLELNIPLATNTGLIDTLGKAQNPKSSHPILIAKNERGNV